MVQWSWIPLIMQKNLARRDNAVKQMTESDPELKNGVRVKLARTMDDIISRLEALTLIGWKWETVMAMVILAKNQWIKKIKNQTSDKQSKTTKCWNVGKCSNNHIENDIKQLIQTRSLYWEQRYIAGWW